MADSMIDIKSTRYTMNQAFAVGSSSPSASSAESDSTSPGGRRAGTICEKLLGPSMRKDRWSAGVLRWALKLSVAFVSGAPK